MRRRPSFFISYLLPCLSSTPSLNHLTLPFSVVSSVVKTVFSPAWVIHVSFTGFFWNLTAASIERWEILFSDLYSEWSHFKKLDYTSPVMCSLNANFSVPASHVYSPASFFSIFSITSSRLFPFDSMWTALLEVRSLPSLYHFTCVFESETSQLRVAFWERDTLTSFWTDSLLEKPTEASAEKIRVLCKNLKRYQPT